MSDPAKLEAEVEMVDTVPSVANGDNEKKATLTDDVFGEITEDGPNYRNVCPHLRLGSLSPGLRLTIPMRYLGWMDWHLSLIHI